MKQNHFLPAHGLRSQTTADVLQARFALRVSAHLTERSADLGPDLTERLRFAREKALERARAVRSAETVASPFAHAMGAGRSGAAILGGGGSRWWFKAASVLPVLALAAGLFMIQRWEDNSQISSAAEIDAALLADDLPPRAYSDVGFAEFLKTPGE